MFKLPSLLLASPGVFVVLLVSAVAGSEPEGAAKRVQEAMVQLAERLETTAPADPALKKQAKQLVAQPGAELPHLMSLFKLRAQGGRGIGAAPVKDAPDGIEVALLELAKAERLERVNDLSQAARLVAAVALVELERRAENRQQDAFDKRGRFAKDGSLVLTVMRDDALKLAAALQAKEVRSVQEIAGRLNQQCASCHELHRLKELLVGLEKNDPAVRLLTAQRIVARSTPIKPADTERVVQRLLPLLEANATRAAAVAVFEKLQVPGTCRVEVLATPLGQLPITERYWFSYLLRDARQRRDAVAPLAASLGNPRWKRGSLVLLRHLGLEAAPAVAQIRPLLADDDESIRVAALETLTNVQDSKASLPILCRTMRAKDPLMRGCAANLLIKMGAGAVPGLSKILDDPDPEICRNAAFALGKIGGDAKPALPRLKELSASKDELLRRVAAQAVQEIEGK